MAIAVQLIADGRAEGRGVLFPEKVFRPADVFAELGRREIRIHEHIT